MSEIPTTPRRAAEDSDLGRKLRLGVSACLLGQEVRFDGSHKRDRFLLDLLGAHAELFPMCPEVGVGMGTPRESIRLVGLPAAPRLVAPRSGRDWTEEMKAWSEHAMERIRDFDLDGFVLKRASPTCGLHRVKVWPEDHQRRSDDPPPVYAGRGLFADTLVRTFPMLPVEEEGRLRDDGLRESFVERLYAWARFRHMLRHDATTGGLVRFHTAHKLMLMARDPETYRACGRVVAEAGSTPWEETIDRYQRLFAAGMERQATRGRHTNVLHHVMGFLKGRLARDETRRMVDTIDDYRRGHVPLVVPVSLLRFHLETREVPGWIKCQTYLQPYPKEMGLRNAV